MDSDDDYLSPNTSNYSSLAISLTPKIEPQSTDYPSTNEFFSIDPAMREALIKTNNGKPTLKPFIISVIVISVIILCVVGTIHIHKVHSSSLYDLDQGTSSTSFIDEDATIRNNKTCTNSDLFCNGHGICIDYSTGCKCDIGYTTYNSLNGTQCNYKQKYQMNAFLLSLFLGEFGAGRFYVGDYVLGAIKLCLIFIGCCIACCFIMGSYAAENGVLMVIGYCGLFCSACGLGVWFIVDIILFAINDIPDQNGVELSPW